MVSEKNTKVLKDIIFLIVAIQDKASVYKNFVSTEKFLTIFDFNFLVKPLVKCGKEDLKQI